MTDSTKRFSSKVADYIKYRPTYPSTVLDFLQELIGLESSWKIADIGSGTGISSKLFLDLSCEVFAVEPNNEMRLAAEQLLGSYPTFHSMNGSSTNTTLPEHSMDLIIAAQAFHWFDQGAFKDECKRISKAEGYVALLWNERLESSPFLIEYEQFIKRFATDYDSIDHRKISDEHINHFFAPSLCNKVVFDNQQSFDYNGLQGRLLSSSYMPGSESSKYVQMLNELQILFDAHQKNNAVQIDYNCTLYVGQIKK